MNDPLMHSGIVVVDKPQGLTSHDVVSRLRRFFRTKKVGHAGTLDPMATGVLVLGIGRGTKLLAHYVAHDKVYAATMRLGQTTDTEDAEGALTCEVDASSVSDHAIREHVRELTGEILQVPSSVSAIKVDGKRAYELAREGKEVNLRARPVTVHSFEMLETRRHGTLVDVDVRVHCSSGTYIRALARDLGASLTVGGHLTALRRESVGTFGLDQARTLEELEDSPTFSYSLDEAMKLGWPEIEVSGDEFLALSQGKWLEPRGLKGVHAAVGPDGRVVALIKESGKRLATEFVARPNTL